VAFFMKTPSWCRKKAAEIGPACAAVIDELMADNALHHIPPPAGFTSSPRRRCPKLAPHP
jgi:hypothetical protein